MTSRARELMQRHITELSALLKRIEPEPGDKRAEAGYQRIKDRLEEAKSHV